MDINDFLLRFKDKEVFGTTDIVYFYASSINEPPNPSTVNWRIHYMIQKGVLHRVGRGKFSLGAGKIYVPDIPRKVKSLFGKIVGAFPYSSVCIWHTSVFNEFMLHQSGKFQCMVEVEKDSAEAVFYFMKERKFSVFLNPDRETMDKYLPENKDAHIVKPLISEAPTQKTGEICTVTIEKMLVDVFCDEILFATQQGAEMRTVFNEALNKYTVNRSKMLRYADRRGRKEGFDDYLETVSEWLRQNKTYDE